MKDISWKNQTLSHGINNFLATWIQRSLLKLVTSVYTVTDHNLKCTLSKAWLRFLCNQCSVISDTRCCLCVRFLLCSDFIPNRVRPEFRETWEFCFHLQLNVIVVNLLPNKEGENMMWIMIYPTPIQTISTRSSITINQNRMLWFCRMLDVVITQSWHGCCFLRYFNVKCKKTTRRFHDIFVIR